MHFSGSGEATFYISNTLLDGYRNAGLGSKFFDALSIPCVLKSPIVVFGGLNREGLEEGFCYVGIPPKRHLDADTTVPPKPNRTYAVYMNKDLKIFDWRWEKTDENKQGCPDKWEIRYAKIIWRA